MLPLLGMREPRARLFRFADAEGLVIIALEDRGRGVFALVGVPGQSSIELSAPQKGLPGFARATYNDRVGVCHISGGAEATLRFIVAAHNQGVTVAVPIGRYLFAKLNL